MIDVGTSNEAVREDKYYIGLKQPRERGQRYDQLLEEFFNAAKEVFGRNVLLQVSCCVISLFYLAFVTISSLSLSLSLSLIPPLSSKISVQAMPSVYYIIINLK